MFPLGWFCMALFPAHVGALLVRLSNYFPSILPLHKLFLMLHTLLPGHIGPMAHTLFQCIMKSLKVFDIRDSMGRLERHALWPPKQINAIFLFDGHLKVCEVDLKFLLSTCMWASDTVKQYAQRLELRMWAHIHCMPSTELHSSMSAEAVSHY